MWDWTSPTPKGGGENNGQAPITSWTHYLTPEAHYSNPGINRLLLLPTLYLFQLMVHSSNADNGAWIWLLSFFLNIILGSWNKKSHDKKVIWVAKSSTQRLREARLGIQVLLIPSFINMINHTICFQPLPYTVHWVRIKSSYCRLFLGVDKSWDSGTPAPSLWNLQCRGTTFPNPI